MPAKTTTPVVRPRFDGERFTWAPLAWVMAIAGGQFFHWAFPPYDRWMLLPVSVALLIGSSFTRKWWVAAVSGIGFGLSAFIPLFSWANIYAGSAPWLALAAFESLYLVLFTVVTRLIYVRHGIGFHSALGVACTWAATEIIRSSVPWGGLSWGASGFAFSDAPLLGLAPWIGMSGLAVITGLIGATLFSFAMSVTMRRRRFRNVAGAVGSGLTIVTIMLTALVVPAPQSHSARDQQSLAIAAIQGNVDPPPPGSYYVPEEMFDNHVQATRAFLDTDSAADLIVWPEDSTGWDLPSNPDREQTVSGLSAAADAPIIVGTQVPLGADARQNLAIEYTAAGRSGQVYAKQRPVPFGEYIPARGFFSKLSDKTDLVRLDMVGGSDPGIFAVGGSKVGVLICFEIAYEDVVAETVRNGAQVLVVQSNNALFGDSNEAAQQVAQARVFSVLTGRSVVHVSTVGDSAIFTPDGEEIRSLDHWTQGAMNASVPLRVSLTPAVRYDRYLTAAPLAIAAIAFIRTVTIRPRYSRHREQP